LHKRTVCSTIETHDLASIYSLRTWDTQNKDMDHSGTRTRATHEKGHEPLMEKDIGPSGSRTWANQGHGCRPMKDKGTDQKENC